MKRIFIAIGMCLAIGVYAFSVTPEKAEARSGACDFDLDCGWNMKCVGSIGNKVCVPK